MTDAMEPILRVFLGWATNFSHRTRPGSCVWESVKKRMEIKDPTKRYLEETNVHYSRRLEGMLLMGNVALQDMSLAAVTPVTGSWAEVTDPIHKKKFLLQRNATGATNGKVQGTFSAASTLNAILTMRRKPGPPHDTEAADQTWSFKVGATSLTLAWNRFGNPTCTGVGFTSEHTITESDRKKFATDTEMRWEISNMGGNLVISCSGFNEDWVIRGVGDIAADTWEFEGNGKLSLNVSQVSFATSGSFETPWLNMHHAYPNGEVTFRVFPEPPAGTTATVEIIEDDGGMRKRLKVTMTGGGLDSPQVSAIEGVALPTFSVATDAWEEASEWVIGGNEEVGSELATRSTNLTFSLKNEYTPGNGTFLEVIGEISGHAAVYYGLGYRYPNGVEVYQPRMYGILRSKTDNGRFLSISVFDRWTEFSDQKLLMAPCLLRRTVRDSAILLAQWCGIATADIVCDDVLDDLGAPKVITDPGYGYDDPKWKPKNGASGPEELKKLCKTYGLTPEFWSDGKLHIYRTVDADWETGIIYSNVDGTDSRYAIGEGEDKGIVVSSDLTGAVNTVIAEAKGPDGESLLAMDYDSDSLNDPTADNYMAYPSYLYEFFDDIDNQADLNDALDELFAGRPAGHRTAQVDSGTGYDMMHRWPRQHVDIQAPSMNLVAHCKITGMTTTFRRPTHKTTMHVEAGAA